MILFNDTIIIMITVIFNEIEKAHNVLLAKASDDRSIKKQNNNIREPHIDIIMRQNQNPQSIGFEGKYKK